MLRARTRVCDDAKDGVDGVWIRGLEDLSLAGAWVPAGAEVAALHTPDAVFNPDFGVGVDIEGAGWGDEVYVEDVFGGFVRAEVVGKAGVQDVDEGGIGCLEGYRDAADFDDDMLIVRARGIFHWFCDSITALSRSEGIAEGYLGGFGRGEGGKIRAGDAAEAESEAKAEMRTAQQCGERAMTPVGLDINAAVIADYMDDAAYDGGCIDWADRAGEPNLRA